MYGELRVLENATSRDQGNKSDIPEMIALLDRMEEQVNDLTMPIAYASMLYELRTHIDLVRGSLKKHADNVAE
jgi:hypothetical protein